MVGGIRQLWRDFPVKQVSVLGVLLTADAFTTSVAAPFIPFLTHDFYPSLKSNQLGYYAGFLMSAFFSGTFVGCFMWGKLSDIVGRRPILLCGVTGLMLSIFMLGFSFSFVWAVGVQFFGGFLNGNLGVAKTYLYEICSPRFHSVAFSIVWIPPSAARFVGPVLGGFLACPATRFHSFAQPFFQRFPYMLPCTVVAVLLLFILIGSCIFLDESLHKKPEDEYITLSPVSTTDMTEHNKEKHHRPQDSTCSLLKDRLVLIPCALYALFALADICASQQLLPLLLVSDSQHGGYNFDAAEISIVMTTTAIYSVITQATLIPFMASKIPYKTVYVSGVVLYAAGVALLPSMVNITGPIKGPHLSSVLSQTANSTDLPLNFTPENLSSSLPVTSGYPHPTLAALGEMNGTAGPLTGQCQLAGDRRMTSQLPASEVPARVWGPLLLVTMLLEQASCQAYMAVIVMVGNAALQSSRGTVNGIAQTLAALSRLVGPAVSANLFAWTTDNGLPWPLNHHLSFYLLVVFCLLMALLCTRLPASSNLPRAAAGNGVHTWPEENSEGTELVEDEEKQSILVKTNEDKTWIDGVDAEDDFETDHLLTSDLA